MTKKVNPNTRNQKIVVKPIKGAKGVAYKADVKVPKKGN